MERQDVYEGIARNLREFGYPDVTAAMIHDTHSAMEAGTELPHGVIGMFAKDQIVDAVDAQILAAPSHEEGT